MTDVCELHAVPLVEAQVRVIYGFAVPGGALNRASRDFPHWKQPALGGCSVSGDLPATSVVRYCPSCQASKIAWERSARKGSG